MSGQVAQATPDRRLRRTGITMVSIRPDRRFPLFRTGGFAAQEYSQGWQYQHRYFQNTLREHGIIQSMSRKGNCYDNCVMETFFGRMKNEMYYGHEKNYDSFDTFAKAVKEYITYYNNERIQKKTKWMPPVKYREASMCA